MKAKSSWILIGLLALVAGAWAGVQIMNRAPAVKALLTDVQRRKLPPFVASALDDRYLKSIRSATSGGGGGMMIPGGGAMIMGGGLSGGAQTLIMRR